ncbi:hypothetical protein [Alkaliphilus serpentinus]|uniref:Uncharacterized protein n=1 Tax=Alkaliphilus serpentinus TaxID=1482731 RepID=A0A833HRL8_9FIRM|nr:hypothetical protein [Alkaliphilus serpentinus]KAB3532117.1 hypothetical protein F8153_03345 [Alkaliphilus serpentinus]
MKKKSKESFRNPQDMIDSTFNRRDYKISEKTINAYVMPLDMVKDRDALDSRRFYNEEWNKELKKLR